MTIKNLELNQFLSPEEQNNLFSFIKGKETPFVVVSLDRVKAHFEDLKNNLSYAKIYYAVKANPDNQIIKLLDSLGSNFDIASRYELDQLLSLGITPDKISYGNTIKKSADIEYAFKKGITIFATDSQQDLEKIGKFAPGSKVFFRLMWDCGGADWPLSRKFGTHSKKIIELAGLAKKLGLISYGISFHVGSQQRDIGQWDDAISQCKRLFENIKKKHGLELKMINLGGGFPAKYINPTESVSDYAKAITNFLHEDFGDNFPEIIVEPGRSMVADAGVLVSSVVMSSQKSDNKGDLWLFIDAGKFNGMIETIDESIKYPIFVHGQASGKTMPMILAGPTCDSMDTMYENYKYEFPEDIKEGDLLLIMTTGAYTSSYASINFNGFAPIKTYITKNFS